MKKELDLKFYSTTQQEKESVKKPFLFGQV